MTLILSIDQLTRSTILFEQYFRDQKSIHIYLIINSNSSNLQVDLHLGHHRGLLRTHLDHISRQPALYLSITYRLPSSLSLFLYGERMDHTNELLKTSVSLLSTMPSKY